ncbi:ankyrin repeat domain-containing protein [Candidatus Micrarchaeota archaeon]|nr:ankyrin repeat domain-containing protein [Candidatus Micrarchaeota archaeon]
MLETSVERFDWNGIAKAFQAGANPDLRVILEDINRRIPILVAAFHTSNYKSFWDYIFNKPTHGDAFHAKIKKLVTVLIENGADPNVVFGVRKSTPLHYLAWGCTSQSDFYRYLNERLYLLDLLLNNPQVTVSPQNIDGDTPLHLATGRKMHGLEIMRKLIERGAKVNAKNNFGKTPLHIAMQLGSIEAVIQLINADAKINLQDAQGNTPIHNAIMAYKGEELLHTHLEWLIAAGADLNIQNNIGNTPLHTLVFRENDDLIVKFVKNGANIHIEGANGRTPYILASKSMRKRLQAINSGVKEHQSLPLPTRFRNGLGKIRQAIMPPKGKVQK